jgi:hypothetical protein
VARKLSGIARVKEDHVDFVAREDGSWRKVWEILAANKMSLAAPVNVAAYRPFDWHDPKDEWIGAVLEADDGQRGSNPLDDYSPSVPPPERGFLPLEKPIILDRRPEGHFSAVAHNRIFSSEFIEALGGKSSGLLGGPVLYRGKQLANWVRFELSARCDVISPLSLLPVVPCALCSSPHTPTLGVWIGALGEPYEGPAALDKLGYGHFAIEHSIVVSLRQAQNLEKHFRGKGYDMVPIYSRHGPTASLALEILGAALPLRIAT